MSRRTKAVDWSEFARVGGRAGGAARARKLSKRRRSEIARKGAIAANRKMARDRKAGKPERRGRPRKTEAVAPAEKLVRDGITRAQDAAAGLAALNGGRQTRAGRRELRSAQPFAAAVTTSGPLTEDDRRHILVSVEAVGRDVRTHGRRAR